jgi:hypothetical protein
MSNEEAWEENKPSFANFIGCGECRDEKDELKVPALKRRSRWCTDVPFCILFLAYWIAMWVLFGTAISDGADINRLKYAWVTKAADSQSTVVQNTFNNICGTGENEGRPLAAWPDPVNSFDLKVCLTSCEHTIGTTAHPFMVDYSAGTGDRGYKTNEYLESYCFPDFEEFPSGLSDRFDTFREQFDSGKEVFQRYVNDFSVAWDVILFAGFFALILGYVYTYAITKFARCMVYTSFILILVGGAFLGIQLLQRAAKVRDTSPTEADQAKAMEILGGIALGATFLFFIILVLLRNRINIAIECVKEASRAVGDMKTIFFIPVLMFMFAALFFVFWIYGALFYFSVPDENQAKPIPFSGDITNQFANVAAAGDADPMFTNYGEYTAFDSPTIELQEIDIDSASKKTLGAHFFFLLWVMQFIVYLTFLVIAGSIADWYFTRRDEEGNKKRGDENDELSDTPVRDALIRSIRYHLGTVAFGSLILAIVQFIRAVVAWLEAQSQEQNNRVQKAIFCCVQCCLKCVQYILDKLSKNAFVFTAIYGDAFCPGAVGAFSLVWRNLIRVAAVSVVSEYLLTLGKIMIALLTTGVSAMVILVFGLDKQMSTMMLPIIFIFIESYVIASLFMAVYDTAIDTIFLCFLIDEEANKDGQMFASEELKQLVDSYAEESAKQANAMKKARGEEVDEPTEATAED